MKNINPKKLKVFFVVFITLFIFLIANTFYGVIYKHDVVVDALCFEYPAGGTFYNYSYFAGRFQAVLVYDGPQAYENVMDSLYGPGVNYAIHGISKEKIESINSSLLEKSTFVEASEFFADIPPMNVCGVAIKLEAQTFLFVSSPVPHRLNIVEQISKTGI